MNSQTLDWGAFVAVIALIVALCAIAAFFLGRKKEAKDSGEREGTTNATLITLANTMSKMERAVDGLGTKIELSNEKMSCKLDISNKEREMEYREMLVKATRLEESNRSLHKRIDFVEKLCKIDIPRNEE